MATPRTDGPTGPRTAPDGTRLQTAPLPPEESLWSRPDEDGILTALMVSPWDSAAALDGAGFDPADLYRDTNRLLYQELRRLMAAGEEPDTYTVLTQLGARGLLDACGGARHISGLGGSFGGTHLTASYARRVQQLAAKRRLLRALLEGIAAVTDGDTLPEIQSGLMRGISTVEIPDGGKGGGLKTAARLSSSVMRGIHDQTRRLPCWPTGLPDLDRLLSGGLRQGGLYVIGGRPKNGKSTLAIAIVAEMVRQGLRAHIDSLEMTDTVDLEAGGRRSAVADEEAAGDLARKLVAYVSGVDSLRVTDAAERMGRDTYERIHAAHLEMSSWALTTDSRPGRTIDQITQQARRIKAQHPDLRVLLVDHAGLVRPRRGEDRRNAMIGVTGELKTLAKDLGIAVLLCAQISRSAEGRPHPIESDLKESGSLEEDCDGTILVMNPKTARLTPDCIALWLSLPVHRHGPSGDQLWLDFDVACGRIGLECPDPTPREEKAPNRDWKGKKR